MATLSTGKIAEVMFDSFTETYEHQTQMLDLVDTFKPSSDGMQNSGNTVWRPAQQHRPILKGWDLTGQEQGIIEETYPAYLGTPNSDLFELRADNMRDMSFWEKAGKQSGLRQATELNKDLATMVKNTGSLFYRSNATSGYDFIAEGQALMSERQINKMAGCHFVLNDRDTLKFGKDLAGRQTLQGQPSQTWASGQIGQNVAGFDVHTGSYLQNLAGGASPDTTITADVSLAPTAGTVNTATNIVTNVDYRVGTLPVVASASYNVGDKITVGAVQSIGLADKSETGQLMTFTVTGKPTATSLEVFPKPIALDDAALSTLEKAYANINTQIKSGDVVARLNIDTTAKTNIFWEKDSIEITAGDAPLGLMKGFGGMKVVSTQLKSGQTMYMMYDGDITKATFRYRLFTWYGLTNRNPMANGVAVTY